MVLEEANALTPRMLPDGRAACPGFTRFIRPAHRRGLALWVYGAVLAQSACQNAVVSALLAVGGFHTVRQYLREWLYDGRDKAAPCSVQVEGRSVSCRCLRWLLEWWQGREVALAVDAPLAWAAGSWR